MFPILAPKALCTDAVGDLLHSGWMGRAVNATPENKAARRVLKALPDWANMMAGMSAAERAAIKPVLALLLQPEYHREVEVVIMTALHAMSAPELRHGYVIPEREK